MVEQQQKLVFSPYMEMYEIPQIIYHELLEITKLPFHPTKTNMPLLE